MEEKKLWLFVQRKLQKGLKVACMWVPKSIGSSPGREGHQMVVASDAAMMGTIGGGVMEYKQVESCKRQLLAGQEKALWQQLIHDPSNKNQWSGLSCSGEQVVLTFFLGQKDLALVNRILNSCEEKENYYLTLKADNSIELSHGGDHALRFSYRFVTATNWTFQYIVGYQETVYLIGGGHVGLALCQQLALLNFKIVLIDNRKELSTEEYDQFISKKIIISYKKVANFVPSTLHDYIVIMSFSSALDTLILSKLINKPARYIGMMASKVKVKRIQATLIEKGCTPAELDRIHTPIGLPIKCKSPAEIAVSIAAQIIAIRNSEK